jgi:hypothetical protein
LRYVEQASSTGGESGDEAQDGDGNGGGSKELGEHCCVPAMVALGRRA